MYGRAYSPPYYVTSDHSCLILPTPLCATLVSSPPTQGVPPPSKDRQARFTVLAGLLEGDPWSNFPFSRPQQIHQQHPQFRQLYGEIIVYIVMLLFTSLSGRIFRVRKYPSVIHKPLPIGAHIPEVNTPLLIGTRPTTRNPFVPP